MSTFRQITAALLVLAGPLFAQETRGRVQGDVRDASGAAIATANVTLANDGTGVRANAVTNETGHYLFDLVTPGHYTVSVQAPGFRAFVQKNVLVETRGDVTVSPTMEVGATRETVTVEASPVAVQFNTATMSNTVDTKLANDLPVISRNPFMFVALDPAVVVHSSTQQEPFHFWAGSQFDVGGRTNDKNDIIMDGTASMTAQKSSYTPPLDAIQQVSVQQNAVDAEFGHTAGGVIVMDMKSGTNDYHGTAYYAGRNPALNAVADRMTLTDNLTRQNTWGGTLGAPIKKNKIFNFFAYEGIHLANPYSTRIETLPTAAERNGDFSQQLNTKGGLDTIYDPWTTQTNGSNVTRTPFPGNAIPASRIDPLAKQFMGGLWQPNNPGDGITGANNFKGQLYDIYPYYNFMDRVDYNISTKLRFFARYNYLHTTETTSDYTGSNSVMRYFQGSARNAQNAAGDLVWAIGPTTVFNIRGSYQGINDSFLNTPTEIGSKGLAGLWPNNPWYSSYLANLPQIYYPNFNVTSSSGTGSGIFSSSVGNYWYQTPETYTIASRLSKTIGNHYLKFGGEFRREIVDAARPAFSQFYFPAGLTANTYLSPNTALSGNGWATFLLGAMDNSSTAQTIPIQHPRISYSAFFVQDDFKINSRLTVNMGLRAEHNGPMVDTSYRLTQQLDLTAPIPELSGANAPQMPSAVTALRTAAPIYNGAWQFTDSSHPGVLNTPTVLWEPRIGVALRIDDKTAFRAGYARYVTPTSLTDTLNILGSVYYDGFSASTSAFAPLQGVPQETLSNPFPSGLVQPIGKGYGTYTNLGNSANWYNPNFQPETNDRINFSLQRQLPGAVLADVTYFMNYGRNLPYTYNLNMADPNIAYTAKNATTAKVSNPFYNLLPANQMPGTLRSQSQVSVSSLLSPYPQYGALNELMQSGAGDHYRALQVSLRRPYSNGLTVMMGFNYNSEQDQGFYDDIATYARTLTWIPAQTSRFRMTGATVYELPVGKGRHFLSHMNPVLDGFIGGWVVSSLFTYNTGVPIRLGGALVNGDPALSNPTRGQWFNTSAISLLPPFTPRTNPIQYSDMVGPHMVNLDSTLGKQFAITERIRFELRFEVYNTLNNMAQADPITSITSANFGRIIDERTGFYGRQIQFSGHLTF
ncbi:MAG: carboxypeptidase regulatory-like domain-containing protein [Acidobacteriota bacterium]|nr:carboxypeptidase regulatory-like domain-containing protein [Acidobacteriota bacterium]